MNLETIPATGSFLSPADQTAISPESIKLLSALQSGVRLASEAIPPSFLSEIRFKAKAAGGEVERGKLDPWLRRILAPTGLCYINDRACYLPTEGEVAAAWRESGLSGLINIPQRFDCDDFAFAFKGHCSRYAYVRGNWGLNGIGLGFVSGDFGWAAGSHAANLFVDYNHGRPQVRFIEPSNGTLYELGDIKQIEHIFI